MAISITLTKGTTTYNLHDMDGLGQNIIMDKTMEIRETLYSGEFKPTLNTAKWEILYNAAVFEATQEEGWLVSIKEDGADLFTGYLRPANSMTYTHAPDRMPLEAVDTTVLIEGTYEGSTIISTAKKTPNPDGPWQTGDTLEEGYFITKASGANSLVHFLVAKTRFGDFHQIDVPDKDYLLNIFRLDRGEDIQKQLAEILWGHGLTYSAKENGNLSLYDWALENPAPTFDFDGSNLIKKFQVKRKDRKTRGVTVGYSEFKRAETKAVCLSLYPQAEISHNRGGGEDRQYCWPPLRDQLGNVIDRSQFDITGELLQAWQPPQIRGLRGEYAWSNIEVTVFFKYTDAAPAWWTSNWEPDRTYRISVTIKQDGSMTYSGINFESTDPILNDPRPLIKECTFNGTEGVTLKIQGPNSWDSKPTEDNVGFGSKYNKLRLYVDSIEAKGDLVYYFHGEKDPDDSTAPRVRTVQKTEGKSLVKDYIVQGLTSKRMAERLAKALDRGLSADIITFESIVKRPIGEIVSINYPEKGFSGVGRIIGITKKRSSSFWIYAYQLETTAPLSLSEPVYTPDLRSRSNLVSDTPSLLQTAAIVSAGLDETGTVRKPLIGNNLPGFDPEDVLSSGLYFGRERVGFYDATLGRWKNYFSSDGEGYFSGKITAGDGIESDDYLIGSRGWRINGNGDAEFRDLIARGKFEAIGGSKLGALNVGIDGSLSVPSGSFAINGTSGDAEFKGKVKSGSVLAGTIEADNAIIKNATGKTLTFEAGSVGGIVMKDGKLSGQTLLADQSIITTVLGGSAQIAGVILQDNAINFQTGKFGVTSGGILTAVDANLTGTVTATAGKIGNWSLVGNDLKSMTSGGNVYLDATKARVTVLDSSNVVKTAMGYFTDLPKEGGGTYGATDYGFYVAPGNTLAFKGGGNVSFSTKLASDASLMIQNATVPANNLAVFGTDSGAVGLHLYNNAGVKTGEITTAGGLYTKGIISSNVNLGRAGFIAYNEGQVAEWFIGQVSGTSHHLFIQKKVGTFYQALLKMDPTLRETTIYGPSNNTQILTILSDSGHTGLRLNSGETTRGFFWWDANNSLLSVGRTSSLDAVNFKNASGIDFISLGIQPDTTLTSYRLQFGSHLHMRGYGVHYAMSFHTIDYGRGDLEIGTKQGLLPGYASDYYPTVKTGGKFLYFTGNGTYYLAMGNDSSETQFYCGTNTLFKFKDSTKPVYAEGSIIAQQFLQGYKGLDAGFNNTAVWWAGSNIILPTDRNGQARDGYAAIRGYCDLSSTRNMIGTIHFFDSSWNGGGINYSQGAINIGEQATIGVWNDPIATFEKTNKVATFRGKIVATQTYHNIGGNNIRSVRFTVGTTFEYIRQTLLAWVGWPRYISCIGSYVLLDGNDYSLSRIRTFSNGEVWLYGVTGATIPITVNHPGSLIYPIELLFISA